MVDRERLAGRGARRVAAGAGEAVPELLVIEYSLGCHRSDLNLIGWFDVGGGSVVRSSS